MNHSWEHTRTQVRQFRANLQTIYPVQVLAITKDFAIHGNVLYFLSNNRDASDWCPTRHMQIYQSRLDQCDTRQIQQQDGPHYLAAISTIPLMERSLAYTDYIALGESELDTSTCYRQLQLPGVSTFDIKDDTIMFTFHHDVYVGKLGKVSPCAGIQRGPSAHAALVDTQINTIQISLCRNPSYRPDHTSHIDLLAYTQSHRHGFQQ